MQLRIFIISLILIPTFLRGNFIPTQQNNFIESSAELKLLWSDAIFTEGPAVAPDGSIYFSAIRTARIMRYDPATALVSTFHEQNQI